jgi:hypothetical protein
MTKFTTKKKYNTAAGFEQLNNQYLKSHLQLVKYFIWQFVYKAFHLST